LSKPFFQNIWEKYVWNTSQKSISGKFDLKGTEAWARLIGYSDNFADEPVSEQRAHGLATVYTCINVRSQTIASLPINVYREDGDSKINLSEHPVYYPLAHQPNSYMSSANMFLTAMIHADSWGNSYIGINRNGRGEVRSLDILQPWQCESINVVDGNAYYNINGMIYPSRDVLHFRWFSTDGLNGISPIRQNANVMGKAIKAEKYSSMALGQKPPGILSYEGNMTAEQRAENQKVWKEDLMAGRTPILSGRWSFEPIMLSPGDAQFIEQEKLTDRKIYGIYRIPPVFAQDFERATFTNAEQSDLIFAKHTILPLVRVIEQECNMKLFSEREKRNTYVKFNMNGLLRGDTQSRAAFYTAMRNIGGMNGNEIREREDMNPYDGGEIYTVQGANVPVDQLREFYESKVTPKENYQEEPMEEEVGEESEDEIEKAYKKFTRKTNAKYHFTK
jgi:HK97 family phage portal protein